MSRRSVCRSATRSTPASSADRPEGREHAAGTRPKCRALQPLRDRGEGEREQDRQRQREQDRLCPVQHPDGHQDDAEAVECLLPRNG